MSTEINNPELLNQPSNNPEIEWSPETDTSLNELITTISLDDVTNQTRKVLNPKDWVENKINKELNWISFYKMEWNELKFDINNITQYLSEFKDLSSYKEYREKVSKDQEYVVLIAVQILLVALWEKNLVIDGLNWRETKKAVIAFQKRYNEHSDDKIKVDWIIGPQTISALLDEANTKNWNPTVDPDVQADPTQDEQPAADPTQDEQPAAGPAQDEQPAVVPAQDEQPAAGPTQDEQPAVVMPNPVIDEDEPSNDDTKPENQESLEVLDENSYWKFNCEYKSGEKFENKEVKDGTELVIKSVKELMFFTKDKNVLRLYNEQYFQTKDLAIKYFDIANTADPGYDIVKAEKKWNEITVSYVDLPASNVYGCDVMTWQCLFVECEKDDKVEWTEEWKNNNNTNNGNSDVVDNGNNDVVDNTDSDMKKIKNDIDKSVNIVNWNITIININNIITIWGEDYRKIEEWETGAWYRIINWILIIWIWDSTGTTRWETIIIDKGNNIYRWDIVDGKMDWIWIIITTWGKVMRERYNKETPIRIVTPNKPDDKEKPDGKEKPNETVETIDGSKYWEIYCDYKKGEKLNDIEIQNWTELVLKSVDELRFFTDDDDLLAKYNEEYFQSKSLAIKYFDICSPNYYEIVKAEKKWGKIVVTYDYKQPEVKHGMWLLSWECLYVECENNEEVEWAEKSENDAEKSEKVKEIVDIKNDLEKYINNWEITIVDGRIKIWGEDYRKIEEWETGAWYRIIDGVLIIWIWDADGNTNWVTIIRETDGSIYKWEIIDGKRTGLWIRIDINYQIERINYDENKIDNAEIIDGIDKKVEDLKKKLADLWSWNNEWTFEFAEWVKDSTTNAITFDGVEYKEWGDSIDGKAYKVEEWKLIIGNFKDWVLEGIAIEYNQDESFYYGKIEAGERNWIGIEYVDGSKYVYLYQKGNISVKEDINSADKEIAEWADIMNTDIDGLSNLIEAWQEKDYDLETIKSDLYATKEKLDEIITWNPGWWPEFKSDVEKTVGWGWTEITYDNKTYTKIDNLDAGDIQDGYHYYWSGPDLFMWQFEAGKLKWEVVEVVGHSIYKHNYENWVKSGTSTLLRSNWDILVGECVNNNWVSREKLLDWDQEKIRRIKSIKEELSRIITIETETDGTKKFVLQNPWNDIELNGNTYKAIPADQETSFTWCWYKEGTDTNYNQKYYVFWNYENGQVKWECIIIYDSWNIYLSDHDEDGNLTSSIKCDTENKVYNRVNNVDTEIEDVEEKQEKIWKIKSIKEELNSIITINETKEFVFPRKWEDIELNGKIYKEIPADQEGTFTWLGYKEFINWDVKHYTFWNFKNWKLEWEAIEIYDSWKIWLCNYNNGVDAWGIKCDSDGKVYDYSYDENRVYQESEITDRNIDIDKTKTYSERFNELNEVKKELSKFRDTFNDFVWYDNDWKVSINPDSTIKVGEDTYLNIGSWSFNSGYWYKVEGKKILFGKFNKNSNTREDWIVYTLSKDQIKKEKTKDWKKSSDTTLYNNGYMEISNYADEWWVIMQQELWNDWTIRVTTYDPDLGCWEYEDNIITLEKPDEDSVEAHINAMADLLNNTVEYDTEKSEFKFKADAERDNETKELTCGWRKYAEWKSDITGRAYTFADFGGQQAFVLGDFVNWKLTWNAAVIMADGRVVSWEFKDNMLDGVAIQKLPEGAVYVYKYSQWREICHEKVSDTNMDIVNQDYMNEIIWEFLSEEEPVKGWWDTQPGWWDTQPGWPDTTRIASDTTTIRW